MTIIHKIAAVVIKDNTFLMVRKAGKDIWTSLGGKPEAGETEEHALLREIREEIGCDANVIRKLGDFEAKAAFDDAIVRLSTYLVELRGPIVLSDPELEEYRFLTRDHGVKLTAATETQIIPYCIREGLLDW